MNDNSTKHLKSLILNITTKLNELEMITDLYQATQQLNDIKKKIEDANNELQEINDGDLSKPLLNTLKSDEQELKVLQTKYKKQLDKWERERNRQKLISGELTGADALKAQREMGLDNIKEVDNQGLIIDSIGENIKGANANLVNVNNELQDQGEQMNRIQEKTLETETQVKQTGKIMVRMEGTAKCIQIITFIAVVVLGLFDIVWIVFLIIRYFKK